MNFILLLTVLLLFPSVLLSLNCSTPINNCTSCDDHNYCLSCDSPLVPSFDLKECQACSLLISNCGTCTTNTSGNSNCSICSTGYAVTLSQSSCEPCSAIDPNCGACSNDANKNPICTSCTIADFSMGLNSSTFPTSCVSCGTLMQNCLTCSGDGGACQSCSGGKTPSGKACVNCGQGIPNCINCTGDGRCQQCYAGNSSNPLGFIISTIDQKSCVSCLADGSLPDALGCGWCNGTSGCLSNGCVKTYGFDPTIGGCKKCIANCDVCQTSLSTCDNCSAGYQWNNYTATCDSVINQCLVTAGTAPDYTCAQCKVNYGLKNQDTSRCVVCSLNNCSICALSSSNVPTCTSCVTGTYWDPYVQQCLPCSAKCLKCSFNPTTNLSLCSQCDANQQGYLQSGSCVGCSSLAAGCLQCSTTGGNLACSSCSVGYYLAANNNSCVSCSQAGLSNCLACSDSATCTSCQSGYYIDSATKTCKTCQGQFCKTCDPSNPSQCQTCQDYYYPDTNGACQTCVSAAANLTSCKSCVVSAGQPSFCAVCQDGWFVNSTTSLCQSCSSFFPGCQLCSSAPACTSCQQYAITDSNNAILSCQSTCQSTQTSMVDSTGLKKCVNCYDAYPINCTLCNSTNCLQCLSNQTFLMVPEQVVCDSCKYTLSVANTGEGTCRLSPVAAVMSIFFQTGLIPTVEVNCNVLANVFFVYGLHSSPDAITLDQIKAKTGSNPTRDVLVPTDDSVTWQTGGIGYGFVMGANTTREINITSPLKNSGETYDLIIYCVSHNGGLVSQAKGFWTQTSNGAKTAVIRLSSNSALPNATKILVCSAMKRTLKLQRQFYTDDGILCPDDIITRLLESNSSNATNSSSNATNNTNNATVYFSYYYINPDYSMNSDTMNTIVNTSLSNQSSFLANLATLLKTDYGLTSISNYASIAGQDKPSFANATPAVFPTSNSISLVLTLTTDGVIYAGIEPTLNITNKRMLFNEFNNRMNNVNRRNIRGLDTTNNTNNTNSSNSTTNATVYNLTLPSISQLMSAKDCDNNNLTLQTISVIANSNVTVTFSNLTANTTYNIYFAGNNLVFPRSYTLVYGTVGTTSLGSTDGSQGQSWGARQAIIGGAWLLVLIFLAWII